MAATTRSQKELKANCMKQLKIGVGDPMEKLRLQCLAHGASGIKGLGRMFTIMDEDGSRKLTREEWDNGLNNYGADLNDDEKNAIFSNLDKDGTGKIDYEEFLLALRPPMSQSRKDIVALAFKKMDKTGDGVITATDMEGVYNVDKHPKFISGEKTKEQIFNDFLKTFEMGGQDDGKVTFEEFLNYYHGVSVSIDSDVYFDLMMRTCWKI